MVQLGYHHAEIARLLIFSKKNKDIVEMSTHEVLTIALYGTCYLINIHEIGAVISLLHDASDILIMVTKFMTESKYGDITAIFFVTECFIWLYTRMIVFPWCAYVVAFQNLDYGEGDWIILPFFGFCLYCLVFMHYYWFYMFMCILKHFATKGEAEDKIADDLDEDDIDQIEAMEKEASKERVKDSFNKMD